MIHSGKKNGYSLSELLVVVALLGIVLSIAVPALSSATVGMQRSSLVNSYFAGLLFTRSEAAKRRVRVVMCKASSFAACSPSGTWDQGWLIFHDANNNALLDAGEAVLQYQQGFPAGWSMTGNLHVSRYISYTPTGDAKLTSGAMQIGTLTLCKRSAGTIEASQIVISSSGRPRTRKVTLLSCE